MSRHETQNLSRPARDARQEHGTFFPVSEGDQNVDLRVAPMCRCFNGCRRGRCIYPAPVVRRPRAVGRQRGGSLILRVHRR
jgi:hypothetical protein